MPALSHGFTLSDLLTLVITLGTATAFVIRVLLSIRDTLRDLKATLGSVEPKLGLLGKVAELEEDLEAAKVQQQEQREWILQHEDRRHADRGLQARRGLVVRKQG